MSSTYKIRLMFEWGGGCIWCDNDAVREKFECGPIEELLPIPESLKSELADMTAWHDKALNWNDPSSPRLWTKDEEEKFDNAVKSIKERLETELGSEYEVTYKYL